MITLQSILPLINEGDWLSSLDFQDAYFHIMNYPPHTGGSYVSRLSINIFNTRPSHSGSLWLLYKNNDGGG